MKQITRIERTSSKDAIGIFKLNNLGACLEFLSIEQSINEKKKNMKEPIYIDFKKRSCENKTLRVVYLIIRAFIFPFLYFGPMIVIALSYTLPFSLGVYEESTEYLLKTEFKEKQWAKKVCYQNWFGNEGGRKLNIRWNIKVGIYHIAASYKSYEILASKGKYPQIYIGFMNTPSNLAILF